VRNFDLDECMIVKTKSYHIVSLLFIVIGTDEHDQCWRSHGCWSFNLVAANISEICFVSAMA
jgi:hypothetical protein